MNKELFKEGYTQNREISWLHFDDRCLNEAKDKTVPLLERLKFVSIFTSNLAEFFMVRIGALYDMANAKYTHVDHKNGMTAAALLQVLYPMAKRKLKKRDEILADLTKKLAKEGIIAENLETLSKEDQKYIKKHFKNEIAPLLSPQIVDIHHPFPNLLSGSIYIAATVRFKKKDEVFAFLPVPESLDPLITLPAKEDELRFVHTEDVVLKYFPEMFPGARILDVCKLTLARSAYLEVEDEAFDDIPDYRRKMMKVLKERKKMNVTMLVLSVKPQQRLEKYLLTHLKITRREFFVCSAPMNMKYAFALAGLLSEAQKEKLLYPPYEPKWNPALEKDKKIFAQVQKKDILLSYPYDSMEPFLQLLKEAANDPKVVSIKITIYRLARQARLVSYLCQAAENGKEVDVLIELKARFDEQNNIDYSQQLEDAGCNVIYGFDHYKVHSKICLVTAVDRKHVSHVALIATGNFNENTARQYTDLALLTARPEIVSDAVVFFQNMAIGNLEGHYGSLLVAPVSLKPGILDLINQEIAKKEKGRIFAKINAITDEEIIARLKEASCAGVKITLFVRGISCILPGIAGKTDNIEIRALVGRYLEHSRIYVFSEGEDEKMFISSADFMTRNTERRVEVAVPIYDPDCRDRIHHMIDIYMADNTKARLLASNGRYHKIHDSEDPFSAQDALMKEEEA